MRKSLDATHPYSYRGTTKMCNRTLQPIEQHAILRKHSRFLMRARFVLGFCFAGLSLIEGLPFVGSGYRQGENPLKRRTIPQ